MTGILTATETIGLSDPAAEYHSIQEEIDEAIGRVLSSGEYVRGEAVREFEEAFAEFSGARQAIATASGTIALVVGLRALDVGPGDEVITAPYTSICTTAAITHAGADIKFADIEAGTLTIDPAEVEKSITERTRAIMPVHLHGQVADMAALSEIAEDYGLLLIEDAALAVGASHHGLPVGRIGQVAAVSFAPSKILGGAGWGGALITSSDELADRARQLAGFGKSEEMEGVAFELEGLNAQLSSLQAAVLNVKLRHLDRWLERRRAIAAFYDEVFDRLGISRLRPPSWSSPSYRTYVIFVGDRDRFIQQLRSAGIGASAHFVPALHLRPVYDRLDYLAGDFPVAERETERLVCLPCHPHLGDSQVEHVVSTVQRIWANGSAAYGAA